MLLRPHILHHGFPGGSDGKASVYNAGDPVSIPRSGRSPGEGNGHPLQHSCTENPVDRGPWCATVHGVAKDQTRLGDSTFFLSCYTSYSASFPIRACFMYHIRPLLLGVFLLLSCLSIACLCGAELTSKCPSQHEATISWWRGEGWG